MVKRLLTALFIFITAQSESHAYVQAQDRSTYNKSLISVYQRSVKRNQTEYTMPNEVKSAIATMGTDGLKVFNTLGELSVTPHMREAVLQEYLRQQTMDGMPWLPISWTQYLQHIESGYTVISQNIDRTISTKNANQPLTDDQLLDAYLFTSSIYHGGDNSLIYQLRDRAHELGIADNARFWDIRCEIHQEPSLRTVKRVEEYIQNSSGNERERAKEILQLLTSLFGNQSVDQYLNSHTLSADQSSLLKKYLAVSGVLLKQTDANAIRAQMDEIKAIFDGISRESMLVSRALRVNVAGNCNLDNRINCSYEMVDLLKQFQTAAYSLGNLWIDKCKQYQVEMSFADFASVTTALLQTNIAVGLVSDEMVKPLAELEALVQNASILPSQAMPAIQAIENGIPGIATRLRRMYGSELEKYKAWVPSADKFVDDTLRSSAILPLTNLLSFMHASLQKIADTKIRVGGEEIVSIFKVLNPGITKGILRIPSPEEFNSPDFIWNPNNIYVLLKTPAEIHKVSGILTTDSGSMISHVQLLAQSHGIPNVFIPKGLIPVLKKLEGQELLLISLPNGEVEIKAWNQATATEKQVHLQYNNLREKNKIRINIPSGVNQYRYPLRLDQLRLSDSGIVAGGKACGQGELARVFDDAVPPAIVLPFGVYYEHMVDSGIYQEIQDVFRSIDLADTSDAAFKERAAKLENIRNKIRSIEFKPDLTEYLLRVLGNDPFRGRGVFVRSDTNAEDLPEFVGAGLNLTIPNVKGVAQILAAIKEVWASPFTPKSLAWRADQIENPWDVIPSVVIQVGINPTKAGIMVVGSTTEEDSLDSVLLAANEGIGITTVNGEFAPEEILVSRKTGEITRVRKAYATSKKRMGPQNRQIIEEIIRNPMDPLIPNAHGLALAQVGDQIQKWIANEYPQKFNLKSKWDLEWGMIDDKVVLFQIRPFIGNKIARNVAELKRLERPKQKKAEAKIAVQDRILNIADQ